MLKATQIKNQIMKLTANLIEFGLSDQENFPFLRKVGQGWQEIGVGARNFSHALRNIPYHEVYSELDRTGIYNAKMLDGALIHLMYLFQNNEVKAHRLAFYPSPSLEEFQNNPDIYLEDEIYADVIMKNIVPFPIRFDFDSREEVVVDVDHPHSHLTLGQYQNCRIPVSSPLTPFLFIEFLLRNFYNTAYQKYHDKITAFKDHSFEATITPREKNMIHIKIPTTRLSDNLV